jgi:hypothetical protein
LPNLLWRHTDGRLAIWEMDRTNRVGKSVLNGGKPVNLEWHLAATADMNGDGHTDFLWQHLDGRVVVWLMQWNEILQKAALNGGRPVADGWRLAAAAHWNRDPHPDLIWRHVDGRVALWRMNGMTRLSSAYLNDSKPVPREWRLVGVNDMYRYPQPQLIWEHQDGRLNVWVMKGVQREHSFSGTGFRPEGPGHISGFGSSWGLWNTPDLCYFQHANGSLTVRGPTMTSPWWTTYLHRSVAPGWKLVGVYPRSE